MTTKKELKEQIKAKRQEIEEVGGIPPYINIQSAAEERMSAWLIEAEQVLSRYQQRAKEEEEELDEPEYHNDLREIDLGEIKEAKTLKQLATAIKNLSQKGNYQDWQFTPWMKNGQLRIYAKDVSYSNPKTRGYFLINTSGEIKKIEESKNRPLPDLPILPRDFYHNDIVAEVSESGKFDIDARVERYLKNEFPDGNYNGQDWDDAYEMFGGR